MSGSPKYSHAELERQRQQQLEEERQKKAVEEARLRAEAVERERRQRLENLRNRVNSQQQSVASQIQQQQLLMYPQDTTDLQQRCRNQINTIRQVQDEVLLQSVATDLNQILQDCDKAVTRKRRDDEEKKRTAEIVRLRFELEELEREVKRIPAGDACKFDATGQSSVQQALGSVQSALVSGVPQTAQTSINAASVVVKQHTLKVAQRRAEWEKRKVEAEQVVGQIQDLLTGLKADPMVVCWHSHSMAQLEGQLKQAQQAIASEQFNQPSQILAKIQVQEKQIIEDANIAQLKADKRDYIAQSIVATLQDMGFAVLSVNDEDQGHPSTAKIFTATAAGRAISVSVPVEGQIWYDVDGYAKNTVSSVTDGSPVAICDEAETVLTEMHTALQQEFGIQMGEISWKGKDPKRTKREAEDLPINQIIVKGSNR